uniref:Uncharacterized protein n=1 Tax=Anopheles atroparvus TaxID=41427 RepID=A0A182JBE0_ANOAO
MRYKVIILHPSVNKHSYGTLKPAELPVKMKLIFVLAIAVCVVASTQAAPQNFLTSLLSPLAQPISNLFQQVSNLVGALGNAAGTTLQSLTSLVPALLALPLQVIPTLTAIPAAVLPTVTGILNTAVSQIAGVVARAGTTLQTLQPALLQVQTILATTVNNLNALNVPGVSGLTSTLTNVANTLGSVLTQVVG